MTSEDVTLLHSYTKWQDCGFFGLWIIGSFLPDIPCTEVVKESSVSGHRRGDGYEIKTVAFHFVSKAEKGCEEKRGIPEFPRPHAG